jgi:hypothetical protein
MLNYTIFLNEPAACVTANLAADDRDGRPGSLDHLVSQHEQFIRDVEVERLSSLEVN